MKVCIIGLDCLEPSLVARWLRDLPTFARLRALGAWGALHSCVPPITVPAWSCMMSGRDPGALGIYGFRNRTGYGYEALGLATSQWVKAPRLWDILGQQGWKCALLGVPGTYPPQPIHGCMITDFLTPSLDSEWAWPASLKSRVRAWLDGEDYLFDVANFRSADKDRILSEIHEMTRRRFRVARALIQEESPDFFMMVEMGSDRIHHAFWHYQDAQHRRYEPAHRFSNAIHDYYVALDHEIAALLDCIDLKECTVIIVSDHGAQRLDGGICINDWLRREGWLVLKAESPAPGTPLAACDVDWTSTRAWAEGGYYARVFLNVAGREPQGVIQPGEYERTRGELGHLLKSIPGDNGQPIATKVHRPETLYPEIEGIAPDLLVILGNLYWRAVGTLGWPALHLLENDTGPDEANHAPDGYFSWASPRLYPASGEAPLDILDFAPRLLAEFRLPLAPGMRSSLASPAALGDAPQPPRPTPSTAASRIVEERLAALGYLG
jgi:predicted AlkP superfamily phosphohydrolase/phosphomutase